MKTIKVIDLLNKIANGEKVPECIMYQGHYYYNVGNEEQAYYENTELDDNLFLYAIHNEGHLNEEVEIIEDTPKEDKKIKKIDISKFPKRNNSLKKTALKLNEIIELLNNSMLLSEKEVANFLDKVNGE